MATQLAHPGLCKATLKSLVANDDVGGAGSEHQAEYQEDCSAIDSGQIATLLQQAWRDFFTGEYHKAVQAGEALGVIGYPVAGYARIAYGRMLARSSEEKTRVLEQAITNADAYQKIAPGSAYSLLISTNAMGRIMEDLSLSAALITGYNSDARQRLEALVQAYPKHARGAATYGGYNGGIIGKSGQFVARISYSATPEKMESGFTTAMRAEPPLISAHLEYAIALERVYGDKQREKARRTLENIVTLTPLEAEEALAQERAKAMLAALDSP